MPTETSKLIDEIAEIVRRVGKRDEIESEIAENVNFSDAVSELIKVDGPVRDAATRAIISFLKGLEIEGDSDEATTILEGIDFKKLVPQLLEKEEFRDAVTSAITDSIENGNLDISEAITESLDEKELQRILTSDETRKAIAEKLQTYIENFDADNLGDDFFEKVDEIAFSKENIEACLKENAEDVNELIMGQVKSYIEGGDDYDNDSPIATAISESKAFNAAVERAVSDLVDSGKVDRLVEKVATEMLSGGDSSLRDKLTQAISDQLVNRIAKTIVAQTLK